MLSLQRALWEAQFIQRLGALAPGHSRPTAAGQSAASLPACARSRLYISPGSHCATAAGAPALPATSHGSRTVVERDVVVHSDGCRQAHVRRLGDSAVLHIGWLTSGACIVGQSGLSSGACIAWKCLMTRCLPSDHAILRSGAAAKAMGQASRLAASYSIPQLPHHSIIHEQGTQQNARTTAKPLLRCRQAGTAPERAAPAATRARRAAGPPARSGSCCRSAGRRGPPSRQR